MDPQKKGPIVVERVEPGERAIGGRVGRALRNPPRLAARRGGLQVIIVNVESLVESVPPLEHDGGHEGGRPVVRGGEPLGEGQDVVGEVVGEIVADTVSPRVEPGQQRRVGRSRHRGGRHRVFEDDPLICECGQCGRLDVVGPIGSQVIRPSRVEGDQHDRWPASWDERGALVDDLWISLRTGGESAEAEDGPPMSHGVWRPPAPTLFPSSA
jgi:hypothetical protein